MKSGGGNVFVRAMRRKGLLLELDTKLVETIENPINFKPLTQDLGHGYEASVLVDVCKAIIHASDAGKLTQSQQGLRAQARILLNAFEKVGVTALIDEATGFQQVRAPDALRFSFNNILKRRSVNGRNNFLMNSTMNSIVYMEAGV